MLSNFCFVEGTHLAGAAHLGRGRTLRENLSELVNQHKICAIVSLSEDALPSETLEEYGIRFLHFPIRDFGVPPMPKMMEGVDFVRKEIHEGNNVVVHCGAGYGRTGTFLACCLVADGMEPDEAIVRVRKMRPGSIETFEQEQFISRWAEYLKRSKKRG